MIASENLLHLHHLLNTAVITVPIFVTPSVECSSDHCGYVCYDITVECSSDHCGYICYNIC